MRRNATTGILQVRNARNTHRNYEGKNIARYLELELLLFTITFRMLHS